MSQVYQSADGSYWGTGADGSWWSDKDGGWKQSGSAPPPDVLSQAAAQPTPPQRAPAPARAAPPVKKQPRRGSRRRVLGIVLLAFVVLIVVLVVTGGSSGTSYSASFQPGGLEVQNPAEVQVFITVKNTGKNPGRPTCTINLSSPGGAYTGFDGITPNNPIRPGGQESYSDTITVTNQGANYVTIGASSVSC